MPVGYLLVSLLQLVFTSSFRGGSFPDALPPGSVGFGKDTDIYGAMHGDPVFEADFLTKF